MSKEEAVNSLIQYLDIDRGKISDGYHTFSELYEHRIALFIALCHVGSVQDVFGGNALNNVLVWKSKYHNDGMMFDGWFIAGIGVGHSQITYHLPLEYWDKLHVAELQHAPAWDGHTSADVLERLQNL